MNNLLSAGFYRLWKNKTFWICLAAAFTLSPIMMLNGCRQAALLAAEGYSRSLDDYYFTLAPMMALFFAVFTSLFIGTEHSDGTMRNKIIVGRTRTQIYLSNLVISTAASVCFTITWLLGGLVGIPFLGTWKMGAGFLLLYAVIAVFFTAALCSIFTLLCMLSPNKAITAVLAILLALGMIVAASMLYNSLTQPEFTTGVIMTANGMQIADPVPNPNFITGTKRSVYQFLIDAFPTGQSILMANGAVSRPVLSLISSAVIALAAALAGIFAFCRKDLK